MQFSDKVADMPVVVVQTVQMQFLDKVVDVPVVRSSWKAERGIVPQITVEIIKVIQLVRDRSWHRATDHGGNYEDASAGQGC